MRVAQAVREMSWCPRCRVAQLEKCATRTGRNHTERVHEALRAALGLSSGERPYGAARWR